MSMHTSANYGPGLYENQTAYSLQRGHRSLTRETEEEEEYDDGISEIAYERFLVWRDEGTCWPIRYFYG